jgi:MFS transporter, DHA1 family, multidrug resistance protein
MIAVGFALLALSTDMTIASFPGMVRYFGVSVSRVQATLSLFVIAFAVSQLVYGPLSDRFGRRPVLLAGMAIYVAASVACLFAPSINAFLAARFLQAIGCCAATVIGRAIIRDVHGAEGTARMIAYISAGMAILILIGPMLGGWLEQQFGWRAIFAFLALLGAAFLAAVAAKLGESNLNPDRGATRIGQTLVNYRVLLADRRFTGHALVVACGYGTVMAFLSGAPFVLMGLYGLSASRFGLVFGLTILGYIGSSLISARLVMRVGAARLLAIGTPLAAAAGTLMAGLALAGVHTVAAIVAPYTLFLLATGLNQPSAVAGAIGPFPRIAGTASALLGFMQLAAGALVGLLVGRLYDGTPVPMTVAIALSTWGAALSFFLVARPVAAGAMHPPA